MKVTLINKEEVSTFLEKHGRNACVCYATNPKFSKGVGKSVLNSGHMSGSRGIYFTFEFEDIPRSAIDQAVRHDVGTFKNVQSFRYVNMENFSYHKSPIIANNKIANEIYESCMSYISKSYTEIVNALKEQGVTGEKANQSARGILPMNTNSKFVMGFTAEALFNFMNKRLCTRAEEHIRKMAHMMKLEVLSVVPEFEPYLVADCEKKLFCDEGKFCCGKYPTKEIVKDLLRDELVLNKMKELRNK